MTDNLLLPERERVQESKVLIIFSNNQTHLHQRLLRRAFQSLTALVTVWNVGVQALTGHFWKTPTYILVFPLKSWHTYFKKVFNLSTLLKIELKSPFQNDKSLVNKARSMKTWFAKMDVK